MPRTQTTDTDAARARARRMGVRSLRLPDLEARAMVEDAVAQIEVLCDALELERRRVRRLERASSPQPADLAREGAQAGG